MILRLLAYAATPQMLFTRAAAIRHAHATVTIRFFFLRHVEADYAKIRASRCFHTRYFDYAYASHKACRYAGFTRYDVVECAITIMLPALPPLLMPVRTHQQNTRNAT